MFSYGSCLSATMFSFKVCEGQHPFSLSNIATVMDVGGKLQSRHEVHIVYMGSHRPNGGDESTRLMHHSMLTTVLGSASSAKDSLVHSYGRSFKGFAAKLSDDEVAKISEMEGVVSVFPNHKMKLHTTRSWDFMGFSKGNLGSSVEGDVVIGLLDSGVWPESDSFNDKGMKPPPAKWKGSCHGANFTCNNKIIGARYYNSNGPYNESDIASPRDSNGHGTHTASTAAGREVADASYLGLAQGVARGGVPGARIAVYKVCWSSGCNSADILAAFDDAIADGVDIISVSLGSDYPDKYFEDSVAIGSFHAMKHGILTSNSAGNSGPFSVSVANFAPWTLTVAASTIDRKFYSKVVLGNGLVFSGLSVNNFDLKGRSYPLIWGGDAANYTRGSSSYMSRLCFGSSLNFNKIRGKIVLCDALVDGHGVLQGNGVGTIMTGSGNADYARSYPLPTTVLSREDAAKVKDYIRTTEYPVATIMASENFKDVMAPTVVSFSSRGPNPRSPDILKPDITAPGVNILAAWSPLRGTSLDGHEDTRSVKYNIISGTSMSCPHASGAAAYVKAAHPNWSAAAIKSALMTTAMVMDSKKHEDLEFAYGSGHINPSAAIDPGLVFDASEADYANFLCKQGYNTTTLRLVTGDNSTCASTEPGRGWDLNYPSFSLYVEDGHEITGIFTRKVTNVGDANSTYTATVYAPPKVDVTVEPSVLSFSAVGETKTFTVKVTGPKISQVPIMSGAVTWTDVSHQVRTPLVIYNYIPGARYRFILQPSAYSMSKNEWGFKGSSMNGIIEQY